MHSLEVIRVMNQIAAVRDKVRNTRATARPATLTRRANRPWPEAETDDGSKTPPQGDPLTRPVKAVETEEQAEYRRQAEASAVTQNEPDPYDVNYILDLLDRGFMYLDNMDADADRVIKETYKLLVIHGRG
jgi:hypothetical protein